MKRKETKQTRQPWHDKVVEMHWRNFSFSQIAIVLNKEGYTSATGKPLTGHILKNYIVKLRHQNRPGPRVLAKINSD
jgi:hypothetical protein